MIRESGLHTSYRRLFARPAAEILLRAGIGPASMSIIAFAGAVAACVSLPFYPFLGGFLILASGYLDTLDGEIARTSGRNGRAGAFLDSMLDRYSDFLFILGILLFYIRSDVLDFTGVLLLLWLAFGILMGNYAQARAEGLDDTCSVGLWERPETIIFLGLSLIMNDLIRIEWVTGMRFFRAGAILGIALIVLTLGTNWMSLRRLFYGYSRLRRRDREEEGGNRAARAD